MRVETDFPYGRIVNNLCRYLSFQGIGVLTPYLLSGCTW